MKDDLTHPSRRGFMKTTLVAGLGLSAGLLPACRSGSEAPEPQTPAQPQAATDTPFLTIGVCGPIAEHAMFEEHGYAYVEPTVRRFLIPQEPDTAFQANLEAFRQLNLPVPVANSFLPGELKVVGPDANEEAVLTYAETAFRRAQQVGIEHIVFGSGGARRIPDSFPRDQAQTQFVELLRKMAPLAGQYGVVLCLEPLRSQETNFLNTIPESVEILEQVKHPNAQLTADIYHVTQEGRGPDDILMAGDYIYHCHIAEDEERAAPGTRDDDFTPYFEALKQINFSGRISVECRWKDKPTELPVAMAALKEQIARV